jgi:septal ring factor EnvC (AmiA/AmiB activator)
MMGRRVREWPRLVAAVAVAAVLLVLIGVVVASASSGGSKTVTAKPAAAVRAAPTTVISSNGDKQQVAKLQSQLKRQSTELTATQKALAASKARTRCWRDKARHPKKDRTVQCPTGSLTK